MYAEPHRATYSEASRDPQELSHAKGWFTNKNTCKHKENPAEECVRMSDKRLRTDVREIILSSLSLETTLNFSSCKMGRITSHFKEKQVCVQSVISRL